MAHVRVAGLGIAVDRPHRLLVGRAGEQVLGRLHDVGQLEDELSTRLQQPAPLDQQFLGFPQIEVLE